MEEKRRGKRSKPSFEGLEGFNKGWRRLEWRRKGLGENRGRGERVSSVYKKGYNRWRKGARIDNHQPNQLELSFTCKTRAAKAPTRRKGARTVT